MTLRPLLLLATLPLCAGAQDTTTAKQDLLAADRASASALVRALAPRASVLLPDFEILTGRTQYRPRLARAGGGVQAAMQRVPIHAVVSLDGGFGCTTGVLRLAAADSMKPSTGRYAACWRRSRDGAWRILAFAASHAPPAVRALPDSLAQPPASAGTHAPRGTQAAQAMIAADRAFAQHSADSGGPAGAFSQWIAADGMLLGPRAVPVRGREQVRQAFGSFPRSGRFEWAPVDSLAAASRDGSLGFTIGQARIAPTPEAVSYSKYLTVWRREPDGSYRFVFDIGNDRPKPTP
jgi:ketosteroid isomerase-like protein